MTESGSRFRTLMLALASLAAAGLVAAYFGERAARTVILNRIAENTALQWADVLSFAVTDVSSDPSDGLFFGDSQTRINKSAEDGLILWYGVFDRSGQVVFSSTDDRRRNLSPDDLTQLRQTGTKTQINIAHGNSDAHPTVAEAFVALPSDADMGSSGFVGVRVNRADAMPLLDRILDMAFAGLCIIVLVVGILSLLVLRKYVRRQSDLEQTLQQTTQDLLRSEAVAKVGHWTAPDAATPSQWSPEMFVIYGRDPETFVPTAANVLACFLPEERKRFQDHVDRMLETRGEMEFESRIQHLDGSVRHVFIKGGVETNDAGDLTRLFGVTQDITERKEIDLALSRNEDMLDRAIEAAGAAIWDWDVIEDSLYVTPQMPEMLGYTADEWKPSIAQHFELCHPDDLERMKRHFQDHLKNKTPYDIEYRIRRKDGTYAWIHSRGRAVWDDYGFVTRMVGAVTDVSQRREEQEHQRQNEATMELAIEAASAGYFDRKWDEDEIYWSPRFREILGITDAGFVPTMKSFNALVHPDDRAALSRQVTDYQSSERPLAIECRVKHADGRWIWVQLRAKIQRDADGNPIRSVGFVIDINDQKTAALELESSKEKLELALAASQAGYFDHNWVEHAVEWSSRVFDILGFNHSFVPDENTFNTLIHPDDLARFDAGTKTMRETGAPLDVEVRIRHGDGRYVWVQVRANRHCDSTGEIVRTIGFIADVSERKRIERELEASKELFEDVATAAGEYIWEFDRRGIFTFVSDRVEAVLGKPAEDVIGRNPMDFMDAETAQDYRKTFVKVMAKKEAFKGLEVPGVHEDGTEFWQQLSGTPILDQDGKLTGYRGVAYDITAQKRAEQALVRSEEKFRDLIEGSIQGLVIHRKFKPLFINDAYARMLGYEQAADMAHIRSLLEILPPEFANDADAFWDRMMSGEIDGQSIRGRVFDRDGKTVWTEAIGRRVTWDGEPAFQITVIDVTEQHRSEEALRESEERFRVVAENATDLITIRGVDGDLMYASPSAQAITGYTPEELITSPRGSMTVEEDVEKLEQRRDDRQAGRYVETKPLLWRMRRKDGQVIWLETSSTSLPLAEGETDHRVMSMSRNVTDRVERERELEAARDRLTRQAEELSELAMRLEEERERAEEANVAKSQFLAKMSHELRTPMTGVLGMVDLLNQTSVDESQQDMLNALHRSASALLDLLNDILDVSKIEAGELELETVDFRLSSVLQDVRELFQPVLSTKGLTFTVNVEDTAVDVLHGDPTRLRQVLLNLIGNANKFTESGGVTLNVSQHAELSDQITMRIDVVDTGVGIAAEDQNRLFQPFVQAEAGTTRKYGGTGLGLAICQQLVEAMGGTIWVDSDLGKGSTFSFTVSTMAGDEAKVEDTAPIVHETKDQAVRALRVLVAEDNTTTQMLLRSMLERNGHSVTTVDNGEEAVAAAQENEFDIILMDMQMPVMDGPQAMTTIRRQDNAAAGRPIIALTADAIREHRQGYVDAGANIVVTKPVNWPILFGEMARLTGAQEPVAKDTTFDEPVDASLVEAGTKMEDQLGRYGEHILLDDAMLDALEEALDRATLQPMVNTFKENMDKYVAELNDLVDGGDLQKSKRTAHALKGLSAQFGASRVSAMARDIEESMTDLNEVKSILPLLRQSIEETKTVLEQR